MNNYSIEPLRTPTCNYVFKAFTTSAPAMASTNFATAVTQSVSTSQEVLIENLPDRTNQELLLIDLSLSSRDLFRSVQPLALSEIFGDRFRRLLSRGSNVTPKWSVDHRTNPQN